MNKDQLSEILALLEKEKLLELEEQQQQQPQQPNP